MLFPDEGGVHHSERVDVHPPPDPIADAPGGLAALGAELAAARSVDVLYGDVPPVEGDEILNEALRQILCALYRLDALDELIEANAAFFATYSPDGEHQLDWTALHHRYVELIEASIAEQLDKFECTANEIVEYARRHATSSRLLAKLIAMGDFAAFCTLMRESHKSVMLYGSTSY